MESVPYSHMTKGTFLIASPDIDVGIFFRAVVLICEHGSSGSFGIIVNKALDVELPEEIIDINNAANKKVSLRAGGPIQTNQMMLLHSSDSISQQALEIVKGIYLGGDLQFLQEAIADGDGPNLCLCFGYSGWGAGQLEREFLNGDWFICPAKAHHLFNVQPDKLWQSLLREMGGKYATYSMIPEDLSLN